MNIQENPSSWAGLRLAIAGRLRLVRQELHGHDGAATLASLLRLPPPTWVNYESGVTIPGKILLRFIELTAISPVW